MVTFPNKTRILVTGGRFRRKRGDLHIPFCSKDQEINFPQVIN